MEAQTVDTLPPWPGPLSCGPPHLRPIVRRMAVADCDREKPRNTTVTVCLYTPNLRKVSGRLAPQGLSAPRYSPARPCVVASCR
jgi:hypothetical protein